MSQTDTARERALPDARDHGLTQVRGRWRGGDRSGGRRGVVAASEGEASPASKAPAAREVTTKCVTNRRTLCVNLS